MKLQQAYVSEAANIGNWAMIGYKGPGEGTATATATTNFEYSEPTSGWTEGTVELSAGMAKAWLAHNKTKLNDCPADDNWYVDVAETNGEASFTATILAANKTNCVALTSNFESIGK